MAISMQKYNFFLIQQHFSSEKYEIYPTEPYNTAFFKKKRCHGTLKTPSSLCSPSFTASPLDVLS